MNLDLPFIWAGIVSFSVIMYVLLDGFVLGVGIIFPWIPNKEYRDIMMNSVAPIWDGNETWLIFGGAALYGAFPLAYSTLLPVLYIPIMLMLAALILRGVSFEFRFKAIRSRFLWDASFIIGSALAAFCQGLILGTFVQGYAHRGHAIPAAYAWFTPFSIMTGIAVVAGYGLLGATWLIMKTEGELQEEMHKTAIILLYVITFFIGVVSIWSPFIDPDIMQRWFSIPNFFYLLPLPVLTLCTIVYAAYGLQKRYETLPFILSTCLFLLAYIGLMISSWPYIVPHVITIWEAAAAEKSLSFLLVGTVILMPLLIGYSIYAYYIFRGKVTAGHSYH